VPPFMMYGHVDVVTTQGSKWDHDPFAGEIADECIWGRGALVWGSNAVIS
jgi:acetylornithine deacetylase/succinyl-diaminopimelate desuccinylase-like protein